MAFNLLMNIKNDELVEVEENGFYFEWDGVYFIHYGKEKMYEYKGKKYNCFPIVYLSEDLSKVEDIELFGCEGDDMSNDGLLFEVDIDFNVWKELKPFKDLMNKANEGHDYLLVGMLLHPKGNYEDDEVAVADYYIVADGGKTAIELLKTKYKVDSDNVENFYNYAPYIMSEDSDGYYLFKRVG